jgi:hypothetical protein
VIKKNKICGNLRFACLPITGYAPEKKKKRRRGGGGEEKKERKELQTLFTFFY